MAIPRVGQARVDYAGAVGWYPGCPGTVEAALARGRTLRAPRWGLPDVLVTFVGTIIIGFLATVAMPSVITEDPPAGPLLLAVVLPWLALAGWPLLAATVRGNGPLIDFGLRLNWRDVGLGMLGGVTAWLILGLVAVITMAITGDFTSAAGEVAANLVADGNRVWLIGFALTVGLGAPIVEEIAFRGLCYDALRKRGLPDVWVIAITALAFAALHFEPVRLPLLLAMGLVTGVLRSKTGGLGAPIVAHAMVNLPGAVLVALGLPVGT